MKNMINDKLYIMACKLRMYVAAQDTKSIHYRWGMIEGYLTALMNLDIITYGQYADALDIVDAIAFNKRKDVPKCIIV